LVDLPEEAFLTETYGPAILSALTSLKKKADLPIGTLDFSFKIR
jgi:hypothetical protein